MTFKTSAVVKNFMTLEASTINLQHYPVCVRWSLYSPGAWDAGTKKKWRKGKNYFHIESITAAPAKMTKFLQW